MRRLNTVTDPFMEKKIQDFEGILTDYQDIVEDMIMQLKEEKEIQDKLAIYFKTQRSEFN